MPKTEKGFETTKLVFEGMRTLVVVVGVVIALFQLSAALNEQTRARYEVTSGILSAFSSADMIQAAATVASFRDGVRPDLTYSEVLQRLTPIRQQFVVWSACMAEEVCQPGPVADMMCDRLVTYEQAFEAISQHYGQPYDRSQRGQQYFGMLEQCRAASAMTFSGRSEP
jgi:hypothetical protein